MGTASYMAPEQVRGEATDPRTDIFAFGAVLYKTLLPIRSKYGSASNDWQVGLNHAYAKKEDSLWYSTPDLVASVLATGRVPEIADAFLIEPYGVMRGLTPTKLREIVEVHPERDDFFRVIVEERLRLSSHRDPSEIETKRLEKALKDSRERNLLWHLRAAGSPGRGRQNRGHMPRHRS